MTVEPIAESVNSSPYVAARVRRYLPTGAPDPGFGGTGAVTTDFRLPPPRLSPRPLFSVDEVITDESDRVLVSGRFTTSHFIEAAHGDRASPFVARLSVAGEVDTGFGNGGKATVSLDSATTGPLAITSTGSIQLGVFGYDPGTYIVRLDPNGGSGATFAGGYHDGPARGGTFDRAERLTLTSLDNRIHRLLHHGDGRFDLWSIGVETRRLVPGRWSRLSGLVSYSGQRHPGCRHGSTESRQASHREPAGRGQADRLEGQCGLHLRQPRHRRPQPEICQQIARDVVLDGRGHAIVAGLVRNSRSKARPGARSLVAQSALVGRARQTVSACSPAVSPCSGSGTNRIVIIM